MNHEIEAELLRPAPRAIRRRTGRGCGNGCVQLFILPHTLIGIGMFLWAVFSTAVLLFGTTVPGVVTATDSSRSSKGSVTYHATFSYALDGQIYSGNSQISFDDYGRLGNGSSIEVKVLRAMPERGAIPLIPGGSRGGRSLFLWFFVLFWNGILSVFYFMIYGPIVRSGRLVRNGVAVLGQVMEKRVSHGKSTSYWIKFAFAPQSGHSTKAPQRLFSTPTAFGADTAFSSAAQDRPIEREMMVQVDDYNALEVADLVTVLHDARKPKRAIIYQCAEHVAQ